MWLKTDPILDDNGNVIRGGMFEHQRRWWNSPRYMKALITGYGGGKTSISAKRAIAVSLLNNGVPYLYVSPSYKLAKRTIVPHLKTMLDGRGIEYRYNKTDHEFILRCHGRTGVIWIGSGDDPDALKGPNIGAANIDEPFIQDEAVFKQIMARVRDPRAKHREITLTGTPEELNWGYEICEGDERKNYDIEVIQSSTLENKTLPQQFIDSLLSGYDPKSIEAYLHGKFVLLGDGIIYSDYCDDNHTDMEFRPGDIHWTHDFNFLPMSSAIIQTYGDKDYVVDEIILDHAIARDVGKEFVERYKDHKNCMVYLYGDPSGKAGEKHGQISNYLAIEEELRNAGFRYERRVLSSTRSIRDSQASLRGRILNAKEERRLFVNPKKSPTTDRGLKTAQLKKGSTFLEDDTNRNQHITTALRYMTEYRYPVFGEMKITVK